MTCLFACVGMSLMGQAELCLLLDLGQLVCVCVLNVDPAAAGQLRLRQRCRIHILIPFGGARILESTPIPRPASLTPFFPFCDP